MDIVERFLKYVSYETTSDESNINNNEASSKGQYKLAEELAKELKELGGEDIYINKFATVHAFFKGTINRDSIFLNSHMDTSPACSGKNIKPRIIDKYDGKDIKLNDNTIMEVKEFPSLKRSIGHSLIVTDGNTLLGGDDKAGIAIIMDMIEYFVTNNIPHAPIEVLFSSDEEIGQGAYHIDVDKLHSKFGFTIDGGDIDYVNIENFNAASMKVEINGRSIHPGSAKDKMINALNVGIDFHNGLPRYLRPEHTCSREGFYHLCDMSGNEEKANMAYIIREHDINKLQNMIDYAKLDAQRINDSFNKEVIKLDINISYKNMYDKLKDHPEIIKLIDNIYKKNNQTYEFEPIRGGTDGATLTQKGYPCPNLGTGGYNFHGRFEYVDIDQMKIMSNMLKDLFR
jgi:tripeptide aminopeptidase